MPIEEKIARIPNLIAWFKKECRAFPWRSSECSPYAIWVSEVMLQQTRAEVVIPYFLRWIAQFPTIEALASAEEEAVMKAWEGLGYYARARRLWQGARFLKERNDSKLPSSYEELLEIPGFGPYTSGAVASFAFHQKAAAVDGNVTRVISRLFSIEDLVEKSEVQKLISELTLELLPEKEPWVAMEAFIELGALICKKSPDCTLCPFEKVCEAKQSNIVGQLPRKKKNRPTEFITRDVVILLHNEQILVRKVQEGQVMAGLYEFPYFERDISDLEEVLPKRFSMPMKCLSIFDSVDHSFTRFHARLHPSLWECSEMRPVEGYSWLFLNELMTLPFSSGHRKILQLLQGALCQR